MKTNDYTIFRNINGNRKVNEGHVLRLTNAIERKNLLPYYPILCNENMEIIDGQHRLAAAVRLGYDVYYEKIAGLRIEDVMEINTNSKSWAIRDFINSWIVLDKPDYRVLRNFMEQYGLSPTIAACLLRGYGQITGGGDISRMIKSGDFKVSSESFAQKIAEQVVEARKHADFEPASDREFIATLMKLNSNHSFDFDRLTSKLKLHELRIQKRPSEKYYILHIEELYNFHNSIVTELYKSTYTV
jgi:hypothetical protein